MGSHQVFALISLVSFLAFITVVLFGTQIAGGAAGAWARGSAQAAAEKWRLANEARAGQSDEVLEAEQAEARRARRAAVTSARNEHGAGRRIAGAAAAGWHIGSRGAERAAAGRRRRRNARRAWTSGGDGTVRPPGSSRSTPRPGGSRPWRGRSGSRPGGSSGSGSTRTRTRSRFRPGRKLGVCVKCGRIAGAASILDGGQICYLCQGKKSPVLCEVEKTPQPTVPSGPALAGAAAPGSVPGAPAAGAVASGPAASSPAAAGPAPEPLPAPGSAPVPVTAETRVPAMAGAPATVIASPTGGTVMTAGIGSGRPGSAVAARTGTGVIEGRVTGRPGAGVAVRGDAANHGEWVEHAKVVIKYVSDMFAFVKVMTEDMGKGECPADAIDETAAWADMIYAYGTQILTELIQINKDIKPWIDAVWAQGGPQNVASPRWLEGRSRRQLQGR